MEQKRKLKTLESSAKVDTQIAAGLTAAGLLSDEGIKAIQQVMQGANDHVQALAHVIFVALGKVREKLQQQNVKIDDRVWIAGGGVLDRVMVEVMGILYAVLGFKDAANSQFVHNVKEAVLDLMQDEESGGEQGEPSPDGDEQQQMPSQQGLAAPSQQPMMGGQ